MQWNAYYGVETLGRDKTYLDLLDSIRGERGDTAESKKAIESDLAEIATKYGIGAAQKAYDACKLESLKIKKPM